MVGNINIKYKKKIDYFHSLRSTVLMMLENYQVMYFSIARLH